jgi:hypothetical protein
MMAQITIVVTDASFVPPFAIHERTKQINRTGGKAGEIEVQFTPVAPHRFRGCRIQFDEQTIVMLESKGITGAGQMAGKTFVIESDTPEDLLIPWRLISIGF